MVLKKPSPDEKEREKKLQKIAERMAFFRKVADFAMATAAKWGMPIVNEEHPSHTHQVLELRNFGGFTFRTEIGKTQMGGKSLKVWFHPKSKFDDHSALVLSLNWMTVITEEELRIEEFRRDERWRQEIISVIDHRSASIIDTIEKTIRVERKKAEEEQERQKRNEEIAARLKRLHLD